MMRMMGDVLEQYLFPEEGVRWILAQNCTTNILASVGWSNPLLHYGPMGGGGGEMGMCNVVLFVEEIWRMNE